MEPRHVLISPTGEQLILDGSQGVRLLRGVDGRYSPPIEHLDDPAVGRDGTVLREVRFGPRDVTLPLAIDTREEPLVAVRELMRWFNPRRGDARLRVTMPDGSRELAGRVSDVMAPDDRGRGTLMVVLTFRAHDPFWRDPANITVNFSLDPPEFFPVPPLELRLGQLSEAAVVDQDGDVEAWPVWQLRGPTPGPVVLSRDGAEPAVLELDRELVEGEVVTIDTRPGRKTVISTVGGSVYANLTAESVLWPLLPGSQTVTIDIPSPGEAAFVTLSYRRRWFTP